MFANRMIKLNPDGKYGDAVERALYNGVLSGVSMDGKSFFYENPLTIDPDFNNVNTCTDGGKRFPITQRKEVFDCSCCPPNVIRLIADIGDYMYSYNEDTIFVHQYINSDAIQEAIVRATGEKLRPAIYTGGESPTASEGVEPVDVLISKLNKMQIDFIVEE
jgi:DUF1680 family protein